MADVTKTSKILSLVAEFTDGDDRTITVENPSNSLTATQINALNNYASGVLIGDQEQASFQRFKSAKVKVASVTYLDLTTPA